MNPRERWLRTIGGAVADRVPLVLPGFECASRSELQKIESPLHREIAERVFDETTFDVIVPSHVNRMLVTPPQRIREEHEDLPGGRSRTLGTIDTPLGELHYVNEHDPISHTDWHVEYPVKSRADIEKIASVPWELPATLSPPDLAELPQDFARRGIVGTSISSPMVCVGGMMKYQHFLEFCATDLALMKELTETCRLRVLDCLTVLLSRPGIDLVWIGGSEWLTPPMASPALYDALVQEQERSLIEYVRENSDAAVHVHCHGRVRDVLPKIIDRGADYTEPVEPPPDGDITMAEAKGVAAGRITLGGNIECRLLAAGTQEEVDAAARAAFEGGNERFILQPTAGPSRVDEHEFRNYMRLIDVWDELSPIA